MSGGFEAVEPPLPSNLLVQKSRMVCLTVPGDESTDVAGLEDPTVPVETICPPDELSPTLELAPTTIVPLRPKTLNSIHNLGRDQFWVIQDLQVLQKFASVQWLLVTKD